MSVHLEEFCEGPNAGSFAEHVDLEPMGPKMINDPLRMYLKDSSSSPQAMPYHDLHIKDAAI